MINKLNSIKLLITFFTLLLLILIFLVNYSYSQGDEREAEIEVGTQIEKERKTKTFEEVKKTKDKLLTHKELKIKYPFNWYISRFGDKAQGSDCDTDEWFPGTQEEWDLMCKPVKFIDTYSNDQIKSVFVHFNDTYFIANPVLAKVLKSLKDDPNSKYQDIQGFFYSKKVLINLGKADCEIIQNIPEYLGYHRELMVEYMKERGHLFRCLPEKDRDDFELFFRAGGLSVIKYASPRVRDLYKRYSDGKIKLEEILPNFNRYEYLDKYLEVKTD
jgi:hypothetical protein